MTFPLAKQFLGCIKKKIFIFPRIMLIKLSFLTFRKLGIKVIYTISHTFRSILCMLRYEIIDFLIFQTKYDRLKFVDKVWIVSLTEMGVNNNLLGRFIRLDFD